MARPAESVYFSSLKPPTLAILSETDAAAYLARLSLPASLLSEPASLSLLSKLLLAHHLAVPYDTSSLHVAPSAWSGPSVPIEFGHGIGMQLGQGNFSRIVTQRKGGFCYATNTLFASLLRGSGFRVSEVGARVYMFRGKNPQEVGYDWSAVTHETLIVDWGDGANGRWLVDVGFGGGGCPYPIPLKHEATAPSLLSDESFLLRSEPLPIDDKDIFHPDVGPGWTFYRRIPSISGSVINHSKAEETDGYWTPAYHFTLNTLCPTDIAMANYYNEQHPQAVWVNFFAVTILLPSGARKTLSYGPGHQEGRMAKLFIKKGINGVEEGLRKIPFETGPIGKVLRDEFGFLL